MRFQKGTVLFWAPEPWVGVRFDYDPNAVASFKAVPRAWDGATKTWWISSTHAPIVEVALSEFGEVRNLVRAGILPGRYANGDPYTYLAVTRNASQKLLEAALGVAIAEAKDEREVAIAQQAYRNIMEDRRDWVTPIDSRRP